MADDADDNDAGCLPDSTIVVWTADVGADVDINPATGATAAVSVRNPLMLFRH